jgi:hypothetical protein
MIALSAQLMALDKILTRGDHASRAAGSRRGIRRALSADDMTPQRSPETDHFNDA